LMYMNRLGILAVGASIEIEGHVFHLRNCHVPHNSTCQFWHQVLLDVFGNKLHQLFTCSLLLLMQLYDCRRHVLLLQS
jgi:hypothetical protein